VPQNRCFRVSVLIAAFSAALTLLSSFPASAQDAPTLLWRFAPGQPAEAGIIEEPVVGSGSVFGVTTHGFDPGGDVFALDAATGERIWQIAIPEAISASPVFADGVVYVGAGSLVSGRSAVYALDATTGEERWRADVTNLDLPATPVDGIAVAGDTLYILSGDGFLRALAAGTGAERWQARLSKPPRGAPVVDGGVVYVATGFDGGILLAFDFATGDERWRVETPDNPSTAPAVAGGLYVVGLLSGELLALDTESGEEQWRALGEATGDDLGLGLPVISNGSVYITGNGTQGGTVVALDAATGAERWRFSPDTPVQVPVDQNIAPVVADGAVYISDEVGALLAVAV
jgi:eukaryotic-like serine/threonine-protein kinase